MTEEQQFDDGVFRYFAYYVHEHIQYVAWHRASHFAIKIWDKQDPVVTDMFYPEQRHPYEEREWDSLPDKIREQIYDEYYDTFCSVAPTVADKVEWKNQYRPDGSVSVETPYVNGQIHGVQKWYYESGELLQETPFFDGQEHGLQKRYHKDGTVLDETRWVDGWVKRVSVDATYTPIKSPKKNKCTCGVESLKEGGLHSSWCDKA